MDRWMCGFYTSSLCCDMKTFVRHVYGRGVMWDMQSSAYALISVFGFGNLCFSYISASFLFYEMSHFQMIDDRESRFSFRHGIVSCVCHWVFAPAPFQNKWTNFYSCAMKHLYIYLSICTDANGEWLAFSPNIQMDFHLDSMNVACIQTQIMHKFIHCPRYNQPSTEQRTHYTRSFTSKIRMDEYVC